MTFTGATVYAEDPMQFDWNVKNTTDNTTCFMAHMGIQVHVMYEKMDGKDKSRAEAILTFGNTSVADALTCDGSKLEVMFNNTDGDHQLWLMFEAGDESYSLQSAMITYRVSEDNFPNATDAGKMVDANSTFMSMFMTPRNMSYNCSMETQFWMNSNDSKHTDIYVRLTGGNTSLTIQPFDFMKEAYSEAQDCFYDQPAASAGLIQYTVEDKTKNVTCALITAMVELTVNYTTIAGQDMSVVIPLTNNTSPGPGQCSSDTTDAMLYLEEEAGNFTMIFKKVKALYYDTFAPSGDFALDTLTLDYNPWSPYFMNHNSMDGSTVKVTETKLGEFKTPMGNSYKCNAATYIDVDDSMTAMFNSTHLQPFEVVNGTFGPASDCEAVTTTAAMTTQPVVTTKPIMPDDIDPTVSDRVIMNKDNTSICLHANIGIQMRTKYAKNDSTMAEAGFNFDANETMTSAECNGTMATITFTRDGDYDQTLKLTFMKDDTAKKSYLSGVEYMYTVTSHFVNATNVGKNYTFTNNGVMELQSDEGKSYKCSAVETDVLVNETDLVILRILGVQVEPFAANKTFAPMDECFSDKKVPKPETGHWSINKTGSNQSMCAKFNFAASVNMTYMTLAGKQRSIKIPLDTTTDAFGTCDDNTTTLVVPMDDGNINFAFVFEKNFTKKDGDDFDYSMTTVHMEYFTSSKYFPNHQYVEGGNVTMINNTLKLFSTDSDHSYKCTANTTAAFNMTDNMITFKDVQVQPFGVKDDGSFLKATDCAADDDLSPLIPIIVGAVLGGLVIVVLVAYVIGRRRNSGPGYESI